MADVAELIVALRLQDGVSRGLGNLNRELRGMQGGLSQVGRGIGQVSAGLGTIATRGAIAAAAGLTAVVTAAVSFEDAFAGVRKTVDATEGQFGDLEDQLREMARTIPVSFEELAGITEAGGALGIAFDGLDEFTRVVADLSATTDVSAEEAARSLGVLGNVLGITAEDYDNFGSALVDLGNKGASTESQILGIAERAGAAGDLIGLSAAQVLGFGAAAANMGIEVEAGGSALQRFFIDSLTAVESGGEDLETFARTAGVTAGQFQTAFREDAGVALADFIEGLGKLPEAVQIQTLADLGFNDVRITRLLLGLAGDVDNLDDSLTIANEAWIANSALGEEAAKRYGTAASQLKILKQNVVDAAVVIGEQLLPIVAELTTEFVAFINKPDTQRALKEFADNLAGGIRDFVAEIRKADFGPLIDTLKGAATIARGAFDAFRSLPAPIQQLALAALVANRVTGGAVGQIASGLGSIAGGLIRIAFERGSTPANALWVQSVTGGLGTGPPTDPTRTGGALGQLLRTLGIITVAAPAGIHQAQTAVGSVRGLVSGAIQDVIDTGDQRKIAALRDELQAQLDSPIGQINAFLDQAGVGAGGGQTLIDSIAALTAAIVPLAPLGPPRPAGLSGFGATGLTALITKIKGLTTLPDTAVLNKDSFAVVLPDTAMAPVTDAIGNLTTVVKAKGPFGPLAPDETTLFPPTVKLDPSQVTDLREPTRLAWLALLDLKYGAVQADMANRAANRFLTFEASRTRQETIARLTTLASKYDSQVASLNGVNARLDSANSKLAAIQAKNFSPTIKVENKVSSTVITNNVVQNRTVAGGYVNLPSRY